MGKARDKGGRRGGAGQHGNQADKVKERNERARLRKERLRDAIYCSSADDREFEAQVEQIGCKIKFIEGDGNCLFRSLADQLEGRPQDHALIRTKVMDHLQRNREVFEPYVEDDESFDDYLKRMRGDAEWGGNQELVAASQLYKVNVVVHQFKAPRFFIPFDNARLTIHLSYHGEHHYNSVRAKGDEGGGPALPITLRTPTSRNGSRGAGSSPWPKQEAAVARSCPWATQPDIVAALESTGGRDEDAIELLIAARNEPGLVEIDEGETDDAPEKGKRAGSLDRSGSGSNGRRSRGGVNGTRNGVDASIAAEKESASASASASGSKSASPLPPPPPPPPGLDGVAGKTGAPNGGGGGGGASAGPSPAAGNRKRAEDKKAGKKTRRSADCPCGSGQKYQKCCRKRDAAIARGQIAAPPSEPAKILAATGEDSALVDDLGSLVI